MCLHATVVKSSWCLSQENAKLACERFRKLIEKHPWKTIHPDLNITMSLGLASNNDLSDISSLFELADTKLYEAKHNGRNQVCF
jgi:diguanylate cyclase (GGDEF)-like protein